ncbi:MFS transporter [Cohnella caldifontis]|uniref:MFS transporter n=1 Tax=Cohnella caldifontis TaxID=3027471 RepID=UPI0023ED607B|nr:MFS transporter [Cohnella sp. YIM B05605]
MESDKRLWTRSFIVLTIGYFLLFLSLHLMLSPLPTYVQQRYRSDDVTISLLTSTFAVFAIASRFLAAWAMKRMHRNAVLIVGLAAATAAIAVYPYASSVEALLLMRAVHGFGFGWASTVIPTLVSQIIPGKRIGEGIGYFGYSTSVAMAVGPAAGLQLLDVAGIHALAWTGAVLAAAILPLLFAGRSIPKQPERKETVRAPGAKDRMNTKTLLPAALNTLLSVVYGGLLGFLSLYGKQLGIDQIGVFFLVSVVTVVAVRPISGRLFDRVGHQVVLIPGAVAVLAGMVALSYARSLGAVLAAALIFGAGFGAIQLTTQAWMLKLADRRHHAAANSLYYNTIDLGVAAGAMLLGAVASAVGYAGMYRISGGIMIVFLALYLVGLAAEKSKKETLQMENGRPVS